MAVPGAGMVAASLACLAPGGSFVEVGKRGIWSAARVAQERPEVQYHLMAVDFLPPKVALAAIVGIGIAQQQRVADIVLL